MTIKKILSSVGIGAGAVIIGLGIQYALAAWTSAPTGTPPNCPAGYAGCDAPINVGANNQAKVGSLTIGSSTALSSPLDVEGVGYMKGLILGQSAGYALTYLDGNETQTGWVLTNAGSGHATWRAVTGGSGPVTVIATTSIPNATVITVSNTKGTLPNFVRWLLVCDSADQGYSVGDQAQILYDQATPNSAWDAPDGPWESSTMLGFSGPSNFQSIIYIPSKTGGGSINLGTNSGTGTYTKWHVKVVAQW